ncbi:MAG TPA: type I methionyl aminopeptidase [candidate division WOR-3 bacterium]|uniref:Methionine aminopeptidase n=1 Tax=candidate division WOR-3 bacterium TaxID=2052148 RepID=A0A7C1BE90_UNCW3|nr:type I methionyl aminopeptidase [candidate division WOR-3 bacterium]
MIIIKSDSEIKGIKEASRIVAEVLEYVREKLAPGTSLAAIDRWIDEYIRKRGGTPTFLGYRGFPKSSCISINNEVVHGIPTEEKVIKEGDLVKVDVGVTLKGYIGDAARTYVIGEVDERTLELVRTTEEALYRGIDAARPGNRLSDISHAIQATAEAHGFSVVRELGGHGVGLKLHEDPIIPNYGKPGRGPVLKAGMVFALEPMLNMGGPEVKTLDDGWTVVTKDGSLSAHFEHTIAIREKGPEILTVI